MTVPAAGATSYTLAKTDGPRLLIRTAGRGDDDAPLIVNTGTVLVYLAGDSMLTPATAIPLGAGLAVPWTAGGEVYGLADPADTSGAKASLFVTAAIGDWSSLTAAAIAAALGTGNALTAAGIAAALGTNNALTANGIAAALGANNALNAAGIAAALGASNNLNAAGIAAALAANGVTAAGIAAQIAAQGVPIIQSSAHILTLSNVTVGAGLPNGYKSAILDARQYESLNLTFKGLFDTAGDHWACIVDWFGDAAGTQYLRSDMFTAYAGTDGMPTLYAAMPAQGNYVRLNVLTDGPNTNTFAADLWGMTIAIPATVNASNQGADIIAFHAGSIAAGVTDVQSGASGGNAIGLFHTAPGSALVTVTIVALIYSGAAGFRQPTIYTNAMPNATEYIAPLAVPAGAALRMSTQNTDASAHNVTNYIVNVA